MFLHGWPVDTIDKWDEDKLKEVVEKKHGGKVKPKTDIVSRWVQAVYDTIMMMLDTYRSVNTS